MLTYRLVGLEEFYALAQDLVKDHFNEVSSSKDDFEFNFNWRIWFDMDRAGFLHIYGVFDGKNLVGYAPVMKVPNLINAHVRTCIVQSIYIDPQYRKGTAGIKLIRSAEKLARALDAEELKVSISKNSKSSKGKPLSGLFTNLGYKFREVVYSKRL